VSGERPLPTLRGLRTGAFAAAILLTALLTAAAADAAPTGLPDRDADPVVLTGADVPGLEGVEPGSIVAFKYDRRWRQIPVQVDERAMIDYKAVRQTTSFGAFSHEAYTDPGTFAGADPDPTLDDGDEIAMMAKDAGAAADDARSPAGVAATTRTRVAIDDPLSSAERFIYLFETNSGLDPAAGRSYVDYDFSLDSGDYKTTYDWNGVADDGAGPPANTEDSTVTTSFYSQHLLARWLEDELAVKAGASTGADILDGDKVQVGFGCGRSELTFSRGGGGFIANTSGPVRAIRSYIGANSGTFTQQDRIYYQRAEVMKTYLRVHAGINTIDQFLDYSPAASGMTYRTSADPGGVTIDGVPDGDLETGNSLGPELSWEQATGPQGSLAIVSRVDTDIPTYSAGSYYQDDSTAPATPQCGGYADDQAWGSSGPGITGVGVNTDPTLGTAMSLTGTRTIFYGAPGADAALAQLRSDQVDAPLEAGASAEAEPPRPALLKLRHGRKKSVAPGRSVRIPVRIRNTSAAVATGIEVCARTAPRVASVGRCRTARRLGPGKVISERFRVTATNRPRRWIKVNFKATADGSKPAKQSVKIAIKR
jgi:hypothetical protein